METCVGNLGGGISIGRIQLRGKKKLELTPLFKKSLRKSWREQERGSAEIRKIRTGVKGTGVGEGEQQGRKKKGVALNVKGNDLTTEHDSMDLIVEKLISQKEQRSGKRRNYA